MNSRKEELEKSIIFFAKEIYNRNLVEAWSGNISSVFTRETCLMTCTGAWLGYLTSNDLVEVAFDGMIVDKNKTKVPTSEKELHLAIYRAFNINVVLHTHSPYTTNYFNNNDSIDYYSIEAKYSLKQIPLVDQDTRIVSKIDEVIEALKSNPIVVLKNHGVISIARTFKEAYGKIELLESQCKVKSTSRF
jgi:L-fuculose-phosphate aldolase